MKQVCVITVYLDLVQKSQKLSSFIAFYFRFNKNFKVKTVENLQILVQNVFSDQNKTFFFLTELENMTKK
jgi:hypothetical protein